MGLGSFLKRTIGAIAFATSSVEKAALGQEATDGLGNGAKQHRRLKQGTLADDLKQGVVTQQVQELRWRMYKLLDESQNYKTKIVGYDEDGMPITETIKFDFSEMASTRLSKIKLDESDPYELEMVVHNDEITLGLLEGMDIIDSNESQINEELDADGDITATHGEVGGEADQSANKPMRPIECQRELRAKFELEAFTKKMNVRKISETERLLEFYVSVYPDEFNRKTRFFISEIKKAMKNPRMCDFLDITGVSFVSYKTLGVKDLHEFEYKVLNFDKIVEFDGYYLIKFKVEVITNGASIYEKYAEGADELIQKYENKEARDGK